MKQNYSKSSNPNQPVSGPQSISHNPAIAIVGNMNVGKTTIFSRLCHRDTARITIPGNPVSITVGRIKGVQMSAFDTPGIYSIVSSNEDERASRDILMPHTTDPPVQGILFVVDAKNMQRSIALALQYAEYGLPMMFAINMVDEASSHGISINCDTLAEIFGTMVCTTVANEGIGIQNIKSHLQDMRVPHQPVQYPDWIEDFLGHVATVLQTPAVSPRALGLLLLTKDAHAAHFIARTFGPDVRDHLNNLAAEYRALSPQPCDILLANLYNRKAQQILRKTQKAQRPSKEPFLVLLEDWCTRPSTGIPIAAAVLYVMYLFVGSFGATILVDNIEKNLFQGVLMPLTVRLFEPLPSAFLRDMFVDPDFGILPTGVFLALGLVLPVIFCFYIAFGLLEDSGYLPRLSILLDRLLKKIGLNGRGVIPLVMGFSCVTMAILTTRVLNNEREKNIASFLLFLCMPCAPLLAVMFIILAKMPLSATVAVFGIIFSQVFIAGYLANLLLGGRSAPFLMEIPAMRLPKLVQVLKLASTKSYFFIKEALPVFIAASLFVFLFERTGGLLLLEKALGPVLGTVLGLPEISIQVFIKTIVRRESGATELQHLAHLYTNLQIVTNLLVMTFIAPCINATIILFKERGLKSASLIVVAASLYAVFLGSVFNMTCRLLGVTFT